MAVAGAPRWRRRTADDVGVRRARGNGRIQSNNYKNRLAGATGMRHPTNGRPDGGSQADDAGHTGDTIDNKNNTLVSHSCALLHVKCC